jgi:hypothetical protein
MEDRIKLYLDNFPDMNRDKAIAMIESFDKVINERQNFCHQLPAMVAKRKAEFERKNNPQTTKRK